MTEQENEIEYKQRAPFSQINNEMIRSNQLGGTAFKLWCVIYSKPLKWTFFWSQILTEMKEKRDAVKAARKELEKLGYLSTKQKRIFTGRGREWKWGGLSFSIFYDPSANPDFTPGLEPKGLSPVTENPSTGSPAAGGAETGKASTDKDLPEKKQSKKDLKKKVGIFSVEKKVWSIEEISQMLSIDTKEAIKKLGHDLTWLLERYVPWMNKKGLPDLLDRAFLSWAKNFTAKIKSPAIFLPKIGSASEASLGPSLEMTWNRLKHLFEYLPEDWEKFFAGKTLEKVNGEWVIKVSDPAALAHAELLQQIKVKIEVK